METANHEFIPLDFDSLEMEPELFKSIAQRCGFTIIESIQDDVTFIKLRKRQIPFVKLYSREMNHQFHFLDISDLHVGSEQFDEEKLIDILKEAKEREVRQVFIAGDLFELEIDHREYDPRIMNEEKRKRIKKRYKEQLRYLVELFSKYSFDYYAINGNHEYVLEQLGIMTPLKEMEFLLRKKLINFNAYDTYIMDFEIAGVVKRMIHLERYYQCKNVFSAMERLFEFNRHGGLEVKTEEGIIPIRFLECGHVHMTMELYNSDYHVFVIQPGCFLKNENRYGPGVFVKGEVTPERCVIRY